MAPAASASRIAGRTAYVPTPITTGATVQIITADGNIYNMTHTSNGIYTATVGNLSGDFIIEARKGDLVLENMFNDIAAGFSEFNAGETNATVLVPREMENEGTVYV